MSNDVTVVTRGSEGLYPIDVMDHNGSGQWHATCRSMARNMSVSITSGQDHNVLAKMHVRGKSD